MQTYEANKRNEGEPFFEQVKYFNCKQSALCTNCKYSEKNVISQTEQVLIGWKEYSYNIFNPKETLSTYICLYNRELK